MLGLRPSPPSALYLLAKLLPTFQILGILPPSLKFSLATLLSTDIWQTHNLEIKPPGEYSQILSILSSIVYHST